MSNDEVDCCGSNPKTCFTWIQIISTGLFILPYVIAAIVYLVLGNILVAISILLFTIIPVVFFAWLIIHCIVKKENACCIYWNLCNNICVLIMIAFILLTVIFSGIGVILSKVDMKEEEKKTMTIGIIASLIIVGILGIALLFETVVLWKINTNRSRGTYSHSYQMGQRNV